VAATSSWHNNNHTNDDDNEEADEGCNGMNDADNNCVGLNVDEADNNVINNMYSRCRVFVNGELVCPHNKKYPLGNYSHGKAISYDSTPVKKTRGSCGQTTSILYNDSKIGFNPREWRFFIAKNTSTRLMLLPPVIKGKQEGYILSVHRSDNEVENGYLFQVASEFIENRPPQRIGKSWDGVGKMVGIGEHLTPTDGHCNFVEYKPCRNHWSTSKEKLTLYECGKIFTKHFLGKNVGYEEMLVKQRDLWPAECPDILTNYPLSYSASKNLGNELHRDNDAARSFAVWVNKKGNESKSWYLLFPEWEVAVEIANGTWISWDGKCCAHCSAVPSVAEDDELLSLFCSLPARLCNHLKKKKQSLES
jgi:hypothetical protein